MSDIMVLGREIPIYGAIGITGVCLALAYALFSCKRFGLSKDDTLYVMVFGAIGAMAGAKLLYLAVSAGAIAGELTSGQAPLSVAALKYMSGGMVFYGGFIGGLAVSCFMARRYGKAGADFFPVIVPAFALAHGISRSGCLLVGCCYGVETSGAFHITYESSMIAPNGVPLIPAQGMEAAGELIIFFILVWLSRRVKDRRDILYAYIFMYAPMRFCLEFLRGDEARGFIMTLSVSQWISLALMGAVVVMKVMDVTVRAWRRRDIRKDGE